MYKMRLSLFLCTLGVALTTQVACSSSLNEQLRKASKSGDCAQVNKLLQAGVDVHSTNIFGDTALHCAARRGHESVVHRLLQAGVNVHATNIFGDTALHCAARRGHESVINRLLLENANIHAVDVFDGTALYLASCYDHKRIVKQLLQAGADVHALNNDALTALHSAKSRAVAQQLVQAGADIEALDKDKKSPLVRYAQPLPHSPHPWEKRNIPEVIGYLISIGAGIDDLLNSDELRKHLRPHVGALRNQAEFLRGLLDEKQDVYPDLQGLIGQYAGFPILKTAVDKMEACFQDESRNAKRRKIV